MAADNAILVMGTTPRFTLEATEDGVTWTGATVTLLFRKPDGTLATPLAATETTTLGTYAYDATTGDLDQTGDWVRAWRVVQGGVDLRTLPHPFSVVASP